MINLGTVGTGWITASFIEAAKLSGKLNLTAVYSRTEDKAKQLAHTYHAAHYFTDIEEMAKSPEIRGCLHCLTQFCSFRTSAYIFKK